MASVTHLVRTFYWQRSDRDFDTPGFEEITAVLGVTPIRDDRELGRHANVSEKRADRGHLLGKITLTGEREHVQSNWWCVGHDLLGGEPTHATLVGATRRNGRWRPHLGQLVVVGAGRLRHRLRGPMHGLRRHPRRSGHG